jgi:hypothetical protein
MEHIIPCPFCGNMPIWVNLAHPSGIPALKCEECQFFIQRDRRDKTMYYWNRRNGPILFECRQLLQKIHRSLRNGGYGSKTEFGQLYDQTTNILKRL